MVVITSYSIHYTKLYENGIFESAKISPVNASGAGDAFISGVVYSFLQKKNIKQTACFATSMSIAALMSKSAVNENIRNNFV